MLIEKIMPEIWYINDKEFFKKFASPYDCTERNISAVPSSYFSIKKIDFIGKGSFLLTYNSTFSQKVKVRQDNTEQNMAVGLLMSFLKKYNRSIKHLVLCVKPNENFQVKSKDDYILSLTFGNPGCFNVQQQENSFHIRVSPDDFCKLSLKYFNATPIIQPTAECFMDFYFLSFVVAII